MEKASENTTPIGDWVYPQGVKNPMGIRHSITECVVGFIASGLEITQVLGEALTQALSTHDFGAPESLTHQTFQFQGDSRGVDMKTLDPEFNGYRFSLVENGATTWQLVLRYNGKDQDSSQLTLHAFRYSDWENFYQMAQKVFQEVVGILPECQASSYLLNYVSAFKIDEQTNSSEQSKAFSAILNEKSNWLPAALSKVDRFDLPLNVSSQFPQSQLRGQDAINYQQLDFRYFVQQRLLRIQHQTQVLPNAEMQPVSIDQLYRHAFLETSRNSMIAHAHDMNKHVMSDLLHADVCKLVGLKSP